MRKTSEKHKSESPGSPRRDDVDPLLCAGLVLALEARSAACAFVWVRGHDGDAGNEAADATAKAAREACQARIALERLVVRLVPQEMWRVLRRRNAALPMFWLARRDGRTIVHMPVLRAATTRAKEQMLLQWAGRTKHGANMRALGVTRDKTLRVFVADACEAMPLPAGPVTARIDGHNVTVLSQSMVLRLQCCDLPVLEPLFRHGSVPGSVEAGLTDVCPRCDQVSETLDHVLVGCDATADARREMDVEMELVLEEAGTRTLAQLTPESQLEPLLLILAGVFRPTVASKYASKARAVVSRYFRCVWERRNKALYAKLHPP
jgi:hypothetical protein